MFSTSTAGSSADEQVADSTAMSSDDDESEAKSQQEEAPPGPSTEPIPLAQLGNYRGGLKIDLSLLQAFKPAPTKSEKREVLEPKVKEPPVSNKPVIPEKKTFDVTNLPYTGRFGESGMYTGLVSEQYEPHGKGTMLYDNGESMRGYWNEGELVRESELYSDEEDDDEDEEDADMEEDLTSSMIDVGAKRDRSRSRSRSRVDEPPPKSPSPPPLPEFEIGDPGKHNDMITDKEEATKIIEQLTYGDGAFIRRSDGKWSYAVVKSMEETQEGRSAIRFTVNSKNSSKSYGKKYWGTHVRPLKGAKLKPPPQAERQGRGRTRDSDSPSNDANGDDRGISCPVTQGRLTSFDWAESVRHGRSRSRRRTVSFSPMRALISIKESAQEEEEEEENETQSESTSGK